MCPEMTQSMRKRAEIIKAAILEFLEKGFDCTSMDKISSRACVSKRTVYNHFKSKDVLFEEIVESLWERCAQVTDVRYNPDTTLREQLLKIAEHEYALQSDEDFKGMIRLYMGECIKSTAIADKAMERVNSMENGITKWMREAIADKRLKDNDPDFMVDQFLGLIKQRAFWPQVLAHAPNLSTEESNKVVVSAVDMFLHYYQV